MWPILLSQMLYSFRFNMGGLKSEPMLLLASCDCDVILVVLQVLINQLCSWLNLTLYFNKTNNYQYQRLWAELFMSKWLLNQIWLSELWYQLLGSEFGLIVFYVWFKMKDEWEMQRNINDNKLCTQSNRRNAFKHTFSTENQMLKFISNFDYTCMYAYKLPLSPSSVICSCRKKMVKS